MATRPYIVGNWKMHGTRAMLAEARAIDRGAERLIGVEVALAPPYTMIHPIRSECELIGVGAQDCHAAEGGAHTGDVSAAMVGDAGAGFVIVGHSERRADHGETDAQVQAKAQAALNALLAVIVCVGETEAQRDSGTAEAVVGAQLDGSLPRTEAVDKVTVAYEPVWAIGTGRTATPEQAQAVHAVLRAQLKAASVHSSRNRILYGGSMNAGNAAELLSQPDIDGGLIGGASLKADEFLSIIASCPPAAAVI